MGFRSAEEIVKDKEKGASELAVDAAETLKHLEEKEAEEYITKIIKNRGTITPLVNLANEFFLAVEKGRDHQDVSNDFVEGIRSAKEDVVENAKMILKDENLSHLATLSYSSTVVETLVHAEEVTVFESRPKREGRKTAEKLPQNIKINYWVDAGMMKASEDVDAVLVGADTVTSDFFVNKLGTHPLVTCVKECGLPVYVAADTTKYLPDDLTFPIGERHPGEEVWDADTDKINVEVHNQYFEAVPLTHDHIYLISEEGVIDEGTLSNLTEQKEVSSRLKRDFPSSEKF